MCLGFSLSVRVAGAAGVPVASYDCVVSVRSRRVPEEPSSGRDVTQNVCGGIDRCALCCRLLLQVAVQVAVQGERNVEMFARFRFRFRNTVFVTPAMRPVLRDRFSACTIEP